MNKKLFIGMFFLAGILLTLFLTQVIIAQTYSRSSPQYVSPGANSINYLGGQGINIFPSFTSDSCQEGQDFIIQIAPFGCTPAVVRSDLLEEQNVPVFCQLVATKTNPLIDVNAIDSISFSGTTPEAVSGVGFHPARAAFSSGRTLLNSPIFETIGYVVIVLRQNKNESSMPDFVNGTLTANIRYDIQNAFGIGRATQYLPELSDEDWNEEYTRYGFWDGKGFLRAEGIDEDGAVISIYSDQNNKISTVSLSKGEKSNQIYLPGFYCAAGLQLRLDGLENPDTRAKLNINGEIVEVADREKFLENKCSIRGIDKQGLVQSVEISCRTDDGFDRFDLKINPTLKLEITDEKGNKEIKEVNVGEKIYDISEGGKSVYLGYIGETIDGDKFIVPVVSPAKTSEEFVNTQIYRQLPNLVEAAKYSTGNIFLDLVLSYLKLGYGLEVFTGNFLVTGSYPVGWIYEIDSSQESFGVDSLSSLGNIPFLNLILGNKIKFLGFAEPVDSEIRDQQTREYYENAISDYREVVDKFPNEKEDSNSQTTFGREALSKAIRLAFDSQQKKTAFELCQEFSDAYPKNKIDVSRYCNDDYKFANTEINSRGVLINGKVKIISFEGISEPSPDEFSAEVSVRSPNGKVNNFILRKNLIVYVNQSNNEYIQLRDLSQDSARLNINLKPSSTISQITGQQFIIGTELLKENLPENFKSNYVFTLTKVNLKKVAKVTVLPNIKNSGTKTNFSFSVGIEKRAIQLSPDQIHERLETLNKTIERWEGISEDLRGVVRGFNAACLAVGTTLTIKNLFQNFDGRAIARQEVMRSSGGWIDICTDKKAAGDFSTIDQCLLANSEQIDEDVDTVEVIIASQEGITDENIDAKLPAIRNLLGNKFTNPDDVNETIDLSEKSNVGSVFTSTGFNEGKISLSQARDLERLQKVLNSNPGDELVDLTRRNIFRILSDIQANSKNFAIQASTQSEVAGLGIGINTYGGEKSIQGVYSGGFLLGSQIGGGVEGFEEDVSYPLEIIVYNNKQYVVLLQGEGSNYYIKNEGTAVYRYGGVSEDGEKLLIDLIIPVGSSIEEAAKGAVEINTISQRFSSFIKFDRTTYINKFKNPEVRFFETAPYKGLPAIVPFDTTNGWYVASRQTLEGFGNIRSYDSSGGITSFYLCNVGKNGREEFNSGSGFGDDICQSFNLVTGQLYNQQFQGLSPSETNQKVNQAKQAIKDASRARQRDPNLKGKVQILGKFIDVGSPAAGVPDIQCQDFMSPDECLILFNTCDPVVCPSSRCNLGGAYTVPDVIQSGVIGSVALCLPNIREDIAVPICLTGVKAGIDSFISVQENYRDCLQTNLETGETIGICDEIHSIYLCDFFWSQAQPFSQVIVPKLFEFATGQTGRGGGEYLGVKSAWESAGQSADYLTNYYGASSFEAFRTGIIKEIGHNICRSFVSASYPSNMDFFDSLIEPESPPQYTAWFSEATFTSATVPPISRYKVFYHIFAGEANARTATGTNAGVFYNVFLRTPTTSSFYQYSPTVSIASGFIPPGDFASETKDFTAPSGYQELCVRVNNQEECGFNRVTTEFALDYVNDLYLQEQITGDINSESDCVSGTPSLYSFINPNLQAGLQDFVDPSLYTEQIVRVCSTDNPGQGTDSLVGTKESRWVDVGTCDQGKGNLKCYLDTDSVKKTVKSTDIENEILGEVSNAYVEGLKQEGFYIQDFEKEVNRIKALRNQDKVNQITSDLIARAFLSIQKAELLLIRANAYADLALSAIGLVIKGKKVSETLSIQCENREVCQKKLGEFVIITVKNIKNNLGIDNIDQNVRNEGVAGSFECLILQIAMQESSLQHCKQLEQNRDPLYCEGKIKDLYLAESTREKSVGIMQINLKAHSDVEVEGRVPNFKDNVIFAVEDVLVEGYNNNKGGRKFEPNGKTYSGWQAAIRSYNGWGFGGNDNYVEEVIGVRKQEIENLFPECGGLTGEKDFNAQDLESAITELKSIIGKFGGAIYYNYKEDPAFKNFVDKIYSKGILTSKEYNDFKSTFATINDDPYRLNLLLEAKKIELEDQTRISWTLDSALKEARNRRGSYSQNQVFVDELCKLELLTPEQCDEIDGGLFGFGEEDMPFVAKELRINIAKEERESASPGVTKEGSLSP